MGDFIARPLRLPTAPVHGTLFVPDVVEPAAAVLLIGGSGGSEPSYVGEALAAEGVAALSIAYFSRPGLPGQLRDIPLEYFFAALQTLADEFPSPDVPLAVLGMSRGSEAAMLTAIHSPLRRRVRGVAVTVPGNVVAGSWPPGGPAWLLGGRPLPYAADFDPDYDDPAWFIPVELVPGPVLLVAAGADRVWPSASMARSLSERLRQHGDPHGHTILEYPEAGHALGYLIPRLPPGLLPPDITDAAVDKAARADAWPQVVEFFRQLPASPLTPAAHDRREDGPVPPERYQSIVDVHMLLRRDGKILLLRRAGETWASGQLCLPSGHVEDGESILHAVIRETEEECDLAFAPDAIRLALSIHQRHPGTSSARIGFAFEPVGTWDGEPVNAEPHKHSELIWADPGDLPPDTVEYAAAIIKAVERGDNFALNGW